MTQFVMWKAVGLVISSLITIASGNTCPQGVASKCGTPIRRGFTASEQATIVRVHNELRNKVAGGSETRGNPGPQPGASNMRVLAWDTDQMSLAQSWADQCTFQHNLCGSNSGQNLYALISSSSATQINVTQACLSWYNEVTKFNRSSVNPFKFTEQTGHYSQLCWGPTSKIGCGYIHYRDADSGNYWHLMGCNYATAGNVIGGSMYNTTGKPCAGCSPSQCHSTYNNLCAQ